MSSGCRPMIGHEAQHLHVGVDQVVADPGQAGEQGEHGADGDADAEAPRAPAGARPTGPRRGCRRGPGRQPAVSTVDGPARMSGGSHPTCAASSHRAKSSGHAGEALDAAGHRRRRRAASPAAPVGRRVRVGAAAGRRRRAAAAAPRRGRRSPATLGDRCRSHRGRARHPDLARSASPACDEVVEPGVELGGDVDRARGSGRPRRTGRRAAAAGRAPHPAGRRTTSRPLGLDDLGRPLGRQPVLVDVDRLGDHVRVVLQVREGPDQAGDVVGERRRPGRGRRGRRWWRSRTSSGR